MILAKTRITGSGGARTLTFNSGRACSYLFSLAAQLSHRIDSGGAIRREPGSSDAHDQHCQRHNRKLSRAQGCYAVQHSTDHPDFGCEIEAPIAIALMVIAHAWQRTERKMRSRVAPREADGPEVCNRRLRTTADPSLSLRWQRLRVGDGFNLIDFPMLAPSERILKVDKMFFLARYQVDAHDVEPHQWHRGLGKLPQVAARQSPQDVALVAVDGGFGGGHILRRAGLHLDEAEEGSQPRDQINIAGPVAA